MSLKFSEELIEWFWGYGVQREKEFAISTSEWVKNLYETRKELLLSREASRSERPAFAIWGPSQTGKSTLASSYIDEQAIFTRKRGEDGQRSALHWEGGTPAFFMVPHVDETKGESIPPWVTVLNPFNGGKDASACLSRFVYGSLRREPGAYHVQSPKHPVELYLVREKDLMHALARGFDTECLGHSHTGLATRWTLERFQEAIGDFKARNAVASPKPSRRAYELLHDFCEVLDDLVFAELPRFAELLEGGDANWKSVLGSLLAEKVLLSDEKLVEDFAALILWDGCKSITEFYRKLNAARKKYESLWQGKTVHCTIQVASLFLDMDACEVFFSPLPDNVREGDRPRVIHESIPNLGFQIEGSRVVLDIEASLPNKIARTAEEFAVLQGLIWEMVVPLNPGHLAPSPFLDFLKRADILDFPGVGNEAPNASTKIACDCVAREPVAPEAGAEGGETPATAPKRGKPFTPQLFFLQILKRGKTASIVSTYAKRLTIDGFNIFQNIDMHPPVNATQLQTGIHTWWKSMVPDYYHNQEGPSPLPLNLALCWWRKVFDEARLDSPIILGNFERIWKALGKIGHPNVSTTYALNYYSFARGRMGRARETVEMLCVKVKEEPSYQTQFNNAVSAASFDTMIADEQTGGTNYFFEQLAQQVDRLRGNSRFNRQSIVQEKEKRGQQRLVDLLTGYNVFAPPLTKNIRVEYLQKLQDNLQHAVTDKPEKAMRDINHALREYLDIQSSALNTVPRNPIEINEQFVRDQYQKWINSQVDRYRAWVSQRRQTKPNWALLGIGSEGMFRDFLNVIVASISPSILREIADWMRRLAAFKDQNAQLSRTDLRPYLAIKMTNAMVYGRQGIEGFDGDTGGEGDDSDDGIPSDDPIGEKCPSYQAFIRPFITTRLKHLINLDDDSEGLGAVTHPEPPIGDAEIRALCKQHNMPVPAEA